MRERRYLPEGSLLGTAENRAYTSDEAGLLRAMEDGAICESLAVRCDCTDMTLCVRLGTMYGYITRDEAVYSPDGHEVKDIAVITRVGRAVSFTVEGFFTDESGKKCARLSRRRAQERCYNEYVRHRVPGDIIPVRVTHLEAFGAFVDIGCGIVSLMTVDTLSVSRIPHPRDRLLAGEDLWAVVRSVDAEGRICMSLRELLGTWEENASDFSCAETVTGIIRSVEEYGVFVELTPNLCGLAELRDGAEPGKSCSVYIKNIIPERMKIKLIIIDTDADALPRVPLRYFVDPARTHHMDEWIYSPACCPRLVRTDF